MKNNLKISISYPPLESDKGVPLLSQNRQFQWFSSPTYIYPMVPAYAATLLFKAGYQVFWDDGIAQKLTYSNWLTRLRRQKPDLIVIESKTPVIKRHWSIITEIKQELPQSKIILVGDHVSTLPEESMQNCPVDFIATGGDYDFLILNIANHLTQKEKLEPGIWYRCGKQIKNTGHFLLNHNLDDLPMIDRDLTCWQLYAYQNGNYRKTPGTYIFSARDCWWGKCTFCSWTTLYPGKDYRKHSVERMLDEIGILIDKYQVKEIFDDSGTFPIGDWLRQFCQGIINRGYNQKIKISCNMRFNALSKAEYQLMGRAGFRLILYGLESANQTTLDKINKNIKLKSIEKELSWAKKAKLEPHITTMIGYHWETYSQAKKTIDFTRNLFRKNLVDSLQATIIIPYPGTPLFRQCQNNNWLLTSDWQDYDQKSQVIKSPLTEKQIKTLTQSLYTSFLTPRFFLNKILAIRSFNDLKYYFKSFRKVIGHLFDFSSH